MELKSVFDAVLAGDAGGVEENIQLLLDGETPADEILQEGLIQAMQEVGRRFEDGDVFFEENE